MFKNLQKNLDYDRILKYAWLLWIPVALYYPRFIKRPEGMIDFPLGASCMLNNEILDVCFPRGWTYPPVFAFIMIPFTFMPMWLRNAIWYALSIGAIYFGLKLCERVVLKIFAVKFDLRELLWFRAITLILSLKFILSVLENQAYDFLVFFLVILGVYGLLEKKDITASLGFSLAAALKATPLIFFPYILFKKRWKVFVLCTVFFLIFSFLPDFFFTQKGTQSGYFVTWMQDIVSPSRPAAAGTGVKAFGQGDNPLNQALNSFVYRMSAAINLQHLFKIMLYTAYTILLFFICYILFKSAKLESPYVLDASVLVVGMLMLSPMSSKSHFVVLTIPNMVIAAYLIREKSFRSLLGYLTLMSFALSTLTSKDILGKKLGELMLNMGCVTISAVLLLIITAMIVFRTRPQTLA